MNCDAVDELLAAYALDAVDADERAAIEAHLATCGQHEEAGELIAAAAGLAWLAEEREPSAELEARLLGAVAASAPTSLPARRPRGIALRWPAAIAAAVVLLAVGFGAGALLPLGTGDESPSIVQVARAEGAFLRAEATAGASPVTVTLDGLERRAEGEGYQLWAVRESGWVSIGICNTNENGWWEGDFDFALAEGDAIAVTVEPVEGSAKPTSQPVLLTTVWPEDEQS
ncbi:MAG: anti-sigma factor [Dehalococcoidia bacterium]